MTFKLFGGAALAYSPHHQDLQNDWCSEQAGVKLVVRSITDISATFAELRGYGGDCEVVSPAWVVEEYYKEIDRMLAKR